MSNQYHCACEGLPLDTSPWPCSVVYVSWLGGDGEETCVCVHVPANVGRCWLLGANNMHRSHRTDPHGWTTPMKVMPAGEITTKTGGGE